MPDFRDPFFSDVFKGMRRDDAEADEEDVSLRVGQRTQTIVILLTGGVEQASRQQNENENANAITTVSNTP